MALVSVNPGNDSDIGDTVFIRNEVTAVYALVGNAVMWSPA